MHFLADGRVVISLFLMTEMITASNVMGEGANFLCLAFLAYLSLTNTEDSINVFWMFLTSI